MKRLTFLVAIPLPLGALLALALMPATPGAVSAQEVCLPNVCEEPLPPGLINAFSRTVGLPPGLTRKITDTVEVSPPGRSVAISRTLGPPPGLTRAISRQLGVPGCGVDCKDPLP